MNKENMDLNNPIAFLRFNEFFIAFDNFILNSFATFVSVSGLQIALFTL